jgi:hypothetical protein
VKEKEKKMEKGLGKGVGEEMEMVMVMTMDSVFFKKLEKCGKRRGPPYILHHTIL